MNESTQASLQEAVRLLRAGEKAAALQLVKRVLADDPRSPQAWWLAAHAAPTPEEARAALQAVLKLQPDHEKARAMLDRLTAPPPAPTPQEHPPAKPEQNPPPADPPTTPTIDPLEFRRMQRRRGCLSSKTLTRIVITVASITVINLAILFLIANLMGSFTAIPVLGDLPIMQQFDTVLTDPDVTPTPGVLYHDAQVTGTVRDGQRQEFLFEGRANTLMFIGIGFATVPQGTNTSGALDLIDPQGYRATVSTSNIEGIDMPDMPLDMGAFSFLQFRLDMDGIWKVHVNGQAGRSAGTYIMMMQCYPEGACRAPAGR